MARYISKDAGTWNEKILAYQSMCNKNEVPNILLNGTNSAKTAKKAKKLVKITW